MEKKYNHLEYEQKISAMWDEHKVYLHTAHQGPLYTIDTPPPTVSGSLHIGHIFSYTQTDIIARYKRMSGFSVFYPFGFDDNGLPTERYVEKKHAISARQIGRKKFTEMILQETELVEKEFELLWKKVGLSVDWNACYSTISERARRISQESFIVLLKKGYIYRIYEPAPYCTTCYTSVAQAELDDLEKQSQFNTLLFRTTDGIDLHVATTRPELLYSVCAVLFHPDDPRYKHLKGKSVYVPLYNHVVPLIADQQVIIEKGTGLVMVSTFGDKTDIAWYKKYKLPYRKSIGVEGRFLPEIPFVGDLKVLPAREKIVQELSLQQMLLSQKNITHAVNVHERCKKEIEYIPLSQWFLRILEYKETFLELANKIEWYPSFMKSRYKNWVENLSWDWCLSRQRFYGIPFPAWHCFDCQGIILPDISQLPIDPQEVSYQGVCPTCKGSSIVPDTDVMDTWNTSSLTPYLCKELFLESEKKETKKDAQEFFPMSMRPQAHDIIRTWAFDTIVKSWCHEQAIPWKEIVISGHVLSDSSEKLSKSKNNARLSPEQLLKEYCADVIRYWTASGSLGHDVAFSDTQLKIGQRLITKLWNAFLFISAHVQDISFSDKHTETSFSVLNQWVLHEMRKTDLLYAGYFDRYEINLALDSVERFFWHVFCDNYIELIKDQLFHPEKYTQAEIQETKWVLYVAGLKIIQWYAPFIPFVTEVIYQELYKKEQKVLSVHQTKFNSVSTAQYQFESAFEKISFLITVIKEIRRIKTEAQLSLKTILSTVTIAVHNAKQEEYIKELSDLLKGIVCAQVILFETNEKSNSCMKKENESWHAYVALEV